MKKAIILTFIILPSLIFSQDSLNIRLNAFLDEWHADAARADMQAYFDKIEENGIYIGTDATEHWTKQASYGLLRGSGVLQLKNGSWKIMQYVLSLPVPNDRFKQVLEVIK